MRAVSNYIIQTLIRSLPVILENIDKEAKRKKLRLNNVSGNAKTYWAGIVEEIQDTEGMVRRRTVESINR